MVHRPIKCFIFLLLLLPSFISQAQDGDRSAFIGLLGGLSGYQGDLQPNSLSFSQPGGWGSLWVRKPINGKLSVRAGVSIGKIKADDAKNRDYLKARNLSFSSSVKEAFLEIQFDLMSIDRNRFSPFVVGGFSIFHFNPYTMDAAGAKVYLQPLQTEGQGLPAYPGRKPYKLFQPALSFGAGLRYAISPNALVSIQASQRKTFTDYIDDVSSSYADEAILLANRGPKAVELAYRGDELPGGPGYPKAGEQRGTPTEMDWYYFVGLSVEIKLSAIGEGLGNWRTGKNDWYNKRCPKIIL